MKKFLLIFTILILILVYTNPSWAISPRVERQNNATRAATSVTKEAKQDANLAKLKENALKLADNRIKRLNKLLSHLQNDKKLSATDKATLANDVQTAINGLTALKTKIENDATTADVHFDAKKLINDYKIYTVFEPKIRLLITIDNLQALSEKVGTLATKLQTLIDEQKSKGRDVSELQTLLNDINNRLKDINTRLASDKAKVLAVSVSSDNARQVFVEVRKDLAEVRAEFAQIRHDIARMRNAFRISLKNATATPRSSTPPAK